MSELELRTLTIESDPTPEMTDWLQAVVLGFHDKSLTEDRLTRWNTEMHAQGMRARGMYRLADQGPAEGVYPGPVGTFMSYDAPINTGNGHLEQANLISDVTVRPSHRRRGVLRQLMTADLTEAHQRGLAFASLTVTEAVIYGRFGFGMSTLHRSIELDVTHNFSLRQPTIGHCEVLDARSEAVQAAREALFERCLAEQRGAHARQQSYRDKLSGAWDYEEGGENRKLRTVGHFSDDGELDAVCTFEYGDWTDHDIKISDLVALTPAAELALWGHLGHHDLVKKITYRVANPDSPLLWALTDARRLQVTGLRDCTWLRVLDPAKALTVRGWEHEGSTVLEISDPMGFAAGRFRVEVSGGQAVVAPTDEPADISLGVEELGSLYFGAVRPSVLAAAGRVTGSPLAIAELDALFAVDQAPYNNAHF